VQVSDIPSIVQVLSAIPTPSGVLVGYADAQLPPVDPSWHERLVSFGAGTLGPEQTPFERNTSELGWTALWLALGNGTGAASASDQEEGMHFVPIDPSGVPSGSVTTVAGDPGRYLLATATGFSVLRSAFDDEGTRPPPVALAMLDPSGNVLSERTVLDASTPADWYTRTGFADGSFLLVWEGNNTGPGPVPISAQHLAEDGTALSPAVLLHTFAATGYGGAYALAPATGGFLFVWSDNESGGARLLAEPFDENGRATGTPKPFGSSVGGPILALAPAPGGDVLAAWDDASETSMGNLQCRRSRRTAPPRARRRRSSKSSPPRMTSSSSLHRKAPWCSTRTTLRKTSKYSRFRFAARIESQIRTGSGPEVSMQRDTPASHRIDLYLCETKP
jgi:hypothetical protein